MLPLWLNYKAMVAFRAHHRHDSIKTRFDLIEGFKFYMVSFVAQELMMGLAVLLLNVTENTPSLVFLRIFRILDIRVPILIDVGSIFSFCINLYILVRIRRKIIKYYHLGLIY